MVRQLAAEWVCADDLGEGKVRAKLAQYLKRVVMGAEAVFEPCLNARPVRGMTVVGESSEVIFGAAAQISFEAVGGEGPQLVFGDREFS